MAESTPNQPVFDRSKTGEKPGEAVGRGQYHDQAQESAQPGRSNTQAPSTVDPLGRTSR